MSHTPRRPQPTPLEYITPTQLVEGDACLWRLGFSRDPAVSTLNRSSPASALGSVAHEVMSKIGQSTNFDSVWDEAVGSVQSALTRDWAPAAVPSPESWPGWSLTKVRTRKSWERSSATHDAHAVHHRGGAGDRRSERPLPWRERWLRHPHLPLAGRPDLVERVQDEVWLVDLKTGLNQGDPTQAQRKQLLFYCALIEATLGELPAYATVETTRNQRFSFAVEPWEVQGVVDEALGLLERVNTEAAEGLNESQAAPSPASCSWCAFRAACRPFFESYDETWPIPHALLFRIESVSDSKHGHSVEGSVLLPHWRTNEPVHLLGLPFKDPPGESEIWAAANFAGRASSAVAGWNTTLWKW